MFFIQVNAHARSITAAAVSGDWLVTASEDTICRLWRFQKDPNGRLSLQHIHGEVVVDHFLIGCSFFGADAEHICLTAFDSNELIMLRKK